MFQKIKNFFKKIVNSKDEDVRESCLLPSQNYTIEAIKPARPACTVYTDLWEVRYCGELIWCNYYTGEHLPFFYEKSDAFKACWWHHNVHSPKKKPNSASYRQEKPIINIDPISC